MEWSARNKITMMPRGTKKVNIDDRQLKVGLLGASFETKNLGIAALVCGSVASICHSYPNARIFLVDYAKEPATYRVMHPSGIAPVELINIRFSKRFYLRNNIALLVAKALFLRLLPSRKWRARLLQNNEVLKTIWEADIIGSIAGGDSFSDIYGLGRLIYMALPQILVLCLGKPLVLLPQTLGPFKGSLAKAIARFILRRSRMVYTREACGFDTVRELVNPDYTRQEFSYDMGFALEPNIRAERIPAWLVKHHKNIQLIKKLENHIKSIQKQGKKGTLYIKYSEKRPANPQNFFYFLFIIFTAKI